jgi:hypothetical protein
MLLPASDTLQVQPLHVIRMTALMCMCSGLGCCQAIEQDTKAVIVLHRTLVFDPQPDGSTVQHGSVTSSTPHAHHLTASACADNTAPAAALGSFLPLLLLLLLLLLLPTTASDSVTTAATAAATHTTSLSATASKQAHVQTCVRVPALACVPTAAVYFNFFLGRSWLVWPHFFFLQFLARGCRRA